ncbi:hypothetical protein [Pseudomonas sp. HMSC08G10]|uniref:hypothetical protein n=1 Tax=Pseudomonas sp. HMSC08G10 TaxID=1581141 RepID=UPI0021158BDE|nr:hypothetical protein [Pseudomonas sp. HMSC08G10]
MYSLEIRSQAMIRVEHIKTATALIKQAWHEQIDAQLAERFGVDQMTKAAHHGDCIEAMKVIADNSLVIDPPHGLSLGA